MNNKSLPFRWVTWWTETTWTTALRIIVIIQLHLVFSYLFWRHFIFELVWWFLNMLIIWRLCNWFEHILILVLWFLNVQWADRSWWMEKNRITIMNTILKLDIFFKSKNICLRISKEMSRGDWDVFSILNLISLSSSNVLSTTKTIFLHFSIGLLNWAVKFKDIINH